MFSKNLFVLPPYNSSWAKQSITEISLIKNNITISFLTTTGEVLGDESSELC